MIEAAPTETEFTVGRYLLRQPIGRGGMASVHLARMRGPLGFTRTVAVKRLHKQFSEEPAFASMLVDEARLASRIRHPNVVPTLDVIAEDGELLLVMEYIHAEALSALITASNAKSERVPVGVGAAIVSAMLMGLHAAHEALDEEGERLQLVHRDVSPQNVLVDADGQTRIVDFGVAKARGRLTLTQPGEIRGKLGYMAPEQLEGENIDRRVDVHAASVVFWEVLTGKRLFGGASDGEVMRKLFVHTVPPPSTLRPDVPGALDDVVLRGLAAAPGDRYATALEMAEAIEATIPLATPREVSRWVQHLAKDRLDARAALVASIERLPPTLGPGAAAGEVAPSELLAAGARIDETLPLLEPTRVVVPRPSPAEGAHDPTTDQNDTVIDVAFSERAPPRRGLVWMAVALGVLLVGAVTFLAVGDEPAASAQRGVQLDVVGLGPRVAAASRAAIGAASSASAPATTASVAASVAPRPTPTTPRPWPRPRPPPTARPWNPLGQD